MSATHDAAVVGGGYAGDCATFALHDAGVSDVVVMPADITARFDAATDTWLLRTSAGEEHRARIVIAAHGPFHVRVEPNIPGCNDFAGPAFHAATWDRDFDPAAKRVAIVDCVAAPRTRLIAVPPRTFMGRILRRSQAAGIESVTAEVERITPAGIRTVDGAEHAVDAIVYAQRYTVSERLRDETVVGRGGLALRKAWQHCAEAYLGIAVHGFPNFFLLDGPGCTGEVDEQMACIVECLEHMRNNGSSRVEVRLSSQRLFLERGRREPVASAFEFSSAGDEDLYDGPAVLVAADQRCDVRVRLTGYLDPIDGKYHWRGSVFDAPPVTSSPVRLDIDDCTAEARITEATPQGSFSISGVGQPPFPLEVQPT